MHFLINHVNISPAANGRGQSIKMQVPSIEYAPVAQLDRVTGYEPVGQGFESLQAYHEKPCVRYNTRLFGVIRWWLVVLHLKSAFFNALKPEAMPEAFLCSGSQ